MQYAQMSFCSYVEIYIIVPKMKKYLFFLLIFVCKVITIINVG